jgi:hypothetical protein
MAPTSSAFEKSRDLKTKKPTAPVVLARGLRNFLIRLQLSPETPLARDGCHATRSVAHARTTHHLAAGHHEIEEYVSNLPQVKGKASQRLDAWHSKK